jgi:hypothetical protein
MLSAPQPSKEDACIQSVTPDAFIHAQRLIFVNTTAKIDCADRVLAVAFRLFAPRFGSTRKPNSRTATSSGKDRNLEKPARNRACSDRQPAGAHLALAKIDRVRPMPTAWRASGCLAGVGLLLALMSGDAVAQQQNMDSGNYMLPHCKRFGEPPGRGSPFMEGVCTGSILSLAFVGPSLTSTLRFCPPQQATKNQIIRVVVAYIEARPARMHEDFRDLARDALRAAWPCQADGWALPPNPVR